MTAAPAPSSGRQQGMFFLVAWRPMALDPAPKQIGPELVLGAAHLRANHVACRSAHAWIDSFQDLDEASWFALISDAQECMAVCYSSCRLPHEMPLTGGLASVCRGRYQIDPVAFANCRGDVPITRLNAAPNALSDS